MDFIDVFAGELNKKKMETANKLGIKISPGHFSVLITRDKGLIRQKRRQTDFISVRPTSKQDMNALLTDTFYDFVIVDSFLLGKRNVRMAKRYETSIAVPVSDAFSLKKSSILRIQKNLLRAQEFGGSLLLCTGAEDASQIRSGYDLVSIGVLLGLKPDYAQKAVRQIPNAIIMRNQKRSKQDVWGVTK
ncbi:MAG: hypothetical protein GOV01_03205 [Candidatus Altiarchaeota archaeon]|nr:hypothetical protein [Candidatus Altiarchaeota archaeon]